QAILFRLQRVLLVLQDLRTEERAEEKDQHPADDDIGDAAAPHDVIRVKAHVVRASISGFSNDNAITPATAVTAAESGDQTKICIANSAPAVWRPATRKIKSNTHFARNRKNPFSARLSAKNTALSHDAPKPTIDIASAAAPKPE